MAYEPIRGGCRGGKDQFNWESVRLMQFKERECYLGSAVALGFLDKGGKWRKKNWWTKDSAYKVEQDFSYQQELERVRAEDQRRIRKALGLEENDQQPSKQDLTQMDLLKLTVKDQEYSSQENQGIGFKKDNVQFTNDYFVPKDHLRLEAVGIDCQSNNYEHQQNNNNNFEQNGQQIKREVKDKKHRKHKKDKKDNKDEKNNKNKKDKKYKKDKNSKKIKKHHRKDKNKQKDKKKKDNKDKYKKQKLDKKN